jgi:hypothetical protein
MLFHLSIEADDPQNVAAVLAELWGGVALPFPPVGIGSWMAFHGADNGTMIEIYPRGTELTETQADAVGVAGPQRRNSATHFAMSTEMPVERVYEIAAREGWSAKYCRRAGKFGVVELWIDGCQMIEVLTPEMQREYLDFVTIDNWSDMLEAGAPQPLAA